MFPAFFHASDSICRALILPLKNRISQLFFAAKSRFLFSSTAIKNLCVFCKTHLYPGIYILPEKCKFFLTGPSGSFRLFLTFLQMSHIPSHRSDTPPLPRYRPSLHGRRSSGCACSLSPRSGYQIACRCSHSSSYFLRCRRFFPENSHSTYPGRPAHPRRQPQYFLCCNTLRRCIHNSVRNKPNPAYSYLLHFLSR